MLRRCGFEVVEVTRHRRIVRVSYAVSRLGTYSRIAERIGRAFTRPIAERNVGIDLGDIVTVVARKPTA
jgi:hypothetical protein